MPLPEVALRLLLATAIGVAMGIDRERKRKPAGIRTLALVGLGGAFAPLIVLEASPPGPDALSRVIQGVLTGVGFLGAGVILQREQRGDVKGLTTAAAIWVVAALGVACGVGLWLEAVIGAAIAISLLWVGEAIETRVFPRREED